MFAATASLSNCASSDSRDHAGATTPTADGYARDVAESAFQKARRIALDRAALQQARYAAVTELEEMRTRDAVEAIIELASRPDEPDSILRASGTALAGLLDFGLVSEWDTRDLAPPAADAFFG
jgi:hypothetical protein